MRNLGTSLSRAATVASVETADRELEVIALWKCRERRVIEGCAVDVFEAPFAAGGVDGVCDRLQESFLLDVAAAGGGA